MTFKHEYIITDQEIKSFNVDRLITRRKEQCEYELSKLIAERFGWHQRGETTLHGPVQERHTLEIEAFPMDKWKGFKSALINNYCYTDGQKASMRNMFEALEALGKPKEVKDER